MEKLTRKESMAIATIHDVLRELHIRGRHANVNMYEECICISSYADTALEAMKVKKILKFFMDDGDNLHVQHYPSSGDISEFFAVKLEKKMV